MRGRHTEPGLVSRKRTLLVCKLTLCFPREASWLSSSQMVPVRPGEKGVRTLTEVLTQELCLAHMVVYEQDY